MAVQKVLEMRLIAAKMRKLCNDNTVLNETCVEWTV